jgi:hypothetical protein
VQHSSGQTFLDIIPARHKDACRGCLTEYFAPSASVRTGFFIWEELLPIIYDKLIETALDQIIREMEGLKCLREWQRRAVEAVVSEWQQILREVYPEHIHSEILRFAQDDSEGIMMTKLVVCRRLTRH